MEFFTKTMAVKLRSHLDKYLAANNNGQTVHQNRNGSALETTWLVELTEPRSNKIRLKSFQGKYLTASETPFLLGVTGNQVLQTFLGKVNDLTVEWEPIRDGFQVKLKSWRSTFLRANRGTPPWRNSVTHYEADMDGTMNWVLWDVEAVDVPAVTGTEVLPAEFCLWSPSANKLSLNHKTKTDNGMELFNNAKAVRLRSHHDKYLHADDDEETVTQDRNGSSPNSKWAVEPVPGFDSIIRLKSVYNKYLTASNQPFLLGMTGRKVLQTRPNRLDSSVEWEPVRDGHQVKLKTRYGNFLRANGGLPPWRNSVTHDIPHRSSTQEWIVWDVDVVEIVVKSPAGQPGKVSVQPVVAHSDSLDFDDSVRGETTSSVSAKSGNFARQESTDSTMSSPPKSEGRTIYYQVADESGEADEDVMECHSLNFKGNGVDELTQQLKEETGLQDIVVCTRSPLNGKLFPLRLQLPPNNANMHVIVVESSSKAAKNFANGMPPR